jgi:hypothetical protein
MTALGAKAAINERQLSATSPTPNNLYTQPTSFVSLVVNQMQWQG